MSESTSVLEAPPVAVTVSPIPVPENKLDNSAVVAVYDTHQKAEDAIRKLQESGFDMKKLSIVGRDYHTEEAVVG